MGHIDRQLLRLFQVVSTLATIMISRFIFLFLFFFGTRIEASFFGFGSAPIAPPTQAIEKSSPGDKELWNLFMAGWLSSEPERGNVTRIIIKQSTLCKHGSDTFAIVPILKDVLLGDEFIHSPLLNSLDGSTIDEKAKILAEKAANFLGCLWSVAEGDIKHASDDLLSEKCPTFGEVIREYERLHVPDHLLSIIRNFYNTSGVEECIRSRAHCLDASKQLSPHSPDLEAFSFLLYEALNRCKKNLYNGSQRTAARNSGILESVDDLIMEKLSNFTQYRKDALNYLLDTLTTTPAEDDLKWMRLFNQGKSKQDFDELVHFFTEKSDEQENLRREAASKRLVCYIPSIEKNTETPPIREREIQLRIRELIKDRMNPHSSNMFVSLQLYGESLLPFISQENEDAVNSILNYLLSVRRNIDPSSCGSS